MGMAAADFVFVMGIRCATRYARLEKWVDEKNSNQVGKKDGEGE